MFEFQKESLKHSWQEMLLFKTLKPIHEPGMMAHACSPYSQEVEAEGWQETLFQKTKTMKKNHCVTEISMKLNHCAQPIY